MRKIFIAITFIFVFVFTSMVSAGEYVLVMSKNDNVCQHMLKLYNEDLKQYGEIKYVQHKEYNTIKWEDKKYYRMRDGKKRYPIQPYESNPTVLISSYDINNDGKKEIVIKDEALTIRGINGDGLYYFKEIESEYFKYDINIDILKKAIGRLVTTVGTSYELKELSQFLYLGIGDKKSKAYYSLGAYLYIHPFFFDGTYYLDVKDEVPYDINKKYSGKYLVILKYRKDNQSQDTCYFLKTNDCKKKRRKGGK